MSHAKFVRFLKKHRACAASMRWVTQNKYTARAAWDNCEEVSWMYWLVLNTCSLRSRFYTIARAITWEHWDASSCDKMRKKIPFNKLRALCLTR